jgi:hypothetical protein
MLRKFAVALVATIAAASGPADAAARHSATSHPLGYRGPPPRYGAALRAGVGALPGVGSRGQERGFGGLSGSGWRQGGFGGTLNPGVGYGFEPQLGGIRH